MRSLETASFPLIVNPSMDAVMRQLLTAGRSTSPQLAAWLDRHESQVREAVRVASGSPKTACEELRGSACELPTRRNPADGGPRAAVEAPDPGVETDCTGEIVYDSDGRRYPVTYRVIAAKVDGSTVVTSHHPQTFDWQTKPPLNYPPEFQTRDLGDQNESAKINNIATNLQPDRLLYKHIDATLGPPVVWPHDGRYYVLGGNGRAIAFLRAPEARYKAYLDMARCRWSCFPDTPAPAGSRWLLVREVHAPGGAHLSKQGAIQLAAASQRSTAASESRIGEAIGQVRSMQLTVENVPMVYQLEPLLGEDMGSFRQDQSLPFGLPDNTNNVFYNKVFRALDPARATAAANNPTIAAGILENVFLGLLPAVALKPSLYEDRRQVDALFGAAPAILTSRLLARDGKIPDDYDLWTALQEAVPLFEWLTEAKPTVKSLVRDLQQQASQVGLFGGGSQKKASRTIEAPPLAWALALALWGAAKTLAPEAKVAGYLKSYFTALSDSAYRPGGGGGGLFGGFGRRAEDDRVPPGDLLGQSVPMYKQVSEVLERVRTRRNPYPLRENRSAAHLASLRAKADSWRGSGSAPVISWLESVTAQNIKKFQVANPHFYAWAVANMPHDDWETAAETVKGAILRSLPPNMLDVKRRGAAGWDAATLLWAAPTLLTVAQAVARGEANPKYDPADHPPEALKMPGAEGRRGIIAWAEAALASDPRQTKLWNPRRTATTVQTILFDRDLWSASAAGDWLRDHGYLGRTADTAAHYHRFRQVDPDRFQRGTLRTIPFGAATGIQAVVGRMK